MRFNSALVNWTEVTDRLWIRTDASSKVRLVSSSSVAPGAGGNSASKDGQPARKVPAVRAALHIVVKSRLEILAISTLGLFSKDSPLSPAKTSEI
jgi:hypothetical protein